MVLFKFKIWDYQETRNHFYWIYTLLSVLFLIEYSHGGGYQLEENQDDFYNYDHSLNVIPTDDPFKSLENSKRLEPYFDPNVNQNVTALVGKSAYLNCIVNNLGNKTVSWIRHRDLHILTVNTYTYTTDQRFRTAHHQSTNEWTLQIQWVQKRDAGNYECQVSTQPIKSYSISLNVIDVNEKRQFYFNRRFPFYSGTHYNNNEYQSYYQSQHDIYGRMYSDFIFPKAIILGGPDYFISKGSTINLTCIIMYTHDPPEHIYWHFKNKILSFETEPRLSQFMENGESFTNYLLIKDVNSNDSGSYVCAPSNAEPDSIQVHVVSGENPEAYSLSTRLKSCLSLMSTLILLLLVSYVSSIYLISREKISIR